RLLMKPFPDEQYDRKPRHNSDSRSTLRAEVHRIYLPAPLDAQAWAEMQTGLSPRLQSDPVGTLHGYAMEVQGNRTWNSLDTPIGACAIRARWILRPACRNHRRPRWISLSPASKAWRIREPAMPVCMISMKCW